MKCWPLLLFLFLQNATAQSLDYLSVRKKNGRVVKNVYAGSKVLLQTTNGAYLEGPVQTIRNDSIYITLYDVRLYRTQIGSVIRDTVTTSVLSVHYKDVSRVYLNKRSGSFQRTAGPLLMIGGAGFLTLNILNGALFNLPVTDSENLKTLGVAAGAFGLGYILQKLFASDGFSKKKHQLVYVDL
jgi:hypothetical protein